MGIKIEETIDIENRIMSQGDISQEDTIMIIEKTNNNNYKINSIKLLIEKKKKIIFFSILKLSGIKNNHILHNR